MIIQDFPNYEIYEDGTIQNIKSLRMMNFDKDKNGYYKVKLYNDGKCKLLTIHRLLALHFIPKIEGKDLVDHINRNREDNRLENLRWVNNSENCSNRSAYKNSKLKEKYITLSVNKNYTYYLLTMRRHNFIKRFNIKKYDLEYVKKIRDNIINGIESTDRTMEKK